MTDSGASAPTMRVDAATGMEVPAVDRDASNEPISVPGEAIEPAQRMDPDQFPDSDAEQGQAPGAGTIVSGWHNYPNSQTWITFGDNSNPNSPEESIPPLNVAPSAPSVPQSEEAIPSKPPAICSTQSSQTIL